MDEINFYTLNGKQYEVVDKKTRETMKDKADLSYADQSFAPAISMDMTGRAVSTDVVSPLEHGVKCKAESTNKLNVKSEETFKRRIEIGVYLEPGEYIITWDSWTQSGEAAEMRYPAVVFNRERAYSLAGPSIGPSGGTRKIVLNKLTRGVLIYSNDWNEELSQNVTATITGLRITKLESPNYTPYISDLAKIRVCQYGGNLFDISSLTKALNWKFDGTAYSGYLYRLYNAFNHSKGGITIADISGLICTISATAKVPSGSSLYVLVNYLDDTNDALVFRSSYYEHKTITAKKPIKLISMSYAGADGITYIRDMTVSVGSIAIETPYVPPKIFVLDSDGTVSGMLSRYPDMTILADDPNVTMEVGYNADTKKYIDNKFADLQAAIFSQGGNI